MKNLDGKKISSTSEQLPLRENVSQEYSDVYVDDPEKIAKVQELIRANEVGISSGIEDMERERSGKGTADRITAVSYTHLDVYKRQLTSSALKG